MSTIQHKTLIVTADIDDIDLLHNKAIQIFKKFDSEADRQSVSNICGHGSNRYVTFIIAPSGSKVGWETYQEHVDLIEGYIEWLEVIGNTDKLKYNLNYVLAYYGEFGSGIEDTNCYT